MLFLEKLFVSPRATVRVISLINLILSALAGALLGFGSALFTTLFGLNVSASILFMVPDEYNDYRSSVFYSALTMSLSVFVSLLLGMDLIGEKLCIILYVLCSMIPLCACLISRTFKAMRDENYLVTKVSGWEIMLCLIKMCFLVAFMSVGLLTSVCAMLFARWWVRILAILFAGFFYALIYLRNITSSPILHYTDTGIPLGERDVYSCVLHPSKFKEDFSYMYDKMLALLEKEQPYLDPEYSLDDMTRALFSNKSYMSKLINICTGLNFSQLINKYRVNHARELFLADNDLKVCELADLSGFHSSVSFNMAFKLFYKVTPGVWCKEIRDKAAIEGKDLSNLQELAL